MLLGVENNGVFEKKERVITDETRGDTIQPRLALNNGLEMRKQAINQFIALYGNRYPQVKRIRVELNECFNPTLNKVEGADYNENSKNDRL